MPEEQHKTGEGRKIIDRERKLLYLAVIVAALVEPMLIYAAYQPVPPSRAALIHDEYICQRHLSACLKSNARASSIACQRSL